MHCAVRISHRPHLPRNLRGELIPQNLFCKVTCSSSVLGVRDHGTHSANTPEHLSSILNLRREVLAQVSDRKRRFNEHKMNEICAIAICVFCDF